MNAPKHSDSHPICDTDLMFDRARNSQTCKTTAPRIQRRDSHSSHSLFLSALPVRMQNAFTSWVWEAEDVCPFMLRCLGGGTKVSFFLGFLCSCVTVEGNSSAKTSVGARRTSILKWDFSASCAGLIDTFNDHIKVLTAETYFTQLLWFRDTEPNRGGS